MDKKNNGDESFYRMLMFFKQHLDDQAYERIYNIYSVAKQGDEKKKKILEAFYRYLYSLVSRGFFRKLSEEEVLSILKKISSSYSSEGSVKFIRK